MKDQSYLGVLPRPLPTRKIVHEGAALKGHMQMEGRRGCGKYVPFVFVLPRVAPSRV